MFPNGRHAKNDMQIVLNPIDQVVYCRLSIYLDAFIPHVVCQLLLKIQLE